MIRKLTSSIVIASALLWGSATDCCAEAPYDGSWEALQQIPIPDWFEDGKVGIFIHWGPASVPAFAYGPPLQPGELEQVMFGNSPRKDLPYAEWYLNSLRIEDSPTSDHHSPTYGLDFMGGPFTFKNTINCFNTLLGINME